MLRSFAVLSLALVFSAALPAQELQGAGAALRQAAANGKKEETNGSKFADEVKAFGFGKGLSSSAAARGWLALFDRLPKSGENGMPSSFGPLVGALPAPEAWDAIAAGLSGRMAGQKGAYPVSVRLFAAVLKSDVAGQKAALTALSALGKGTSNGTYIRSQVGMLTSALTTTSGNPMGAVEAFVASLSPTLGRGQLVEIPNLVSALGTAKSESLLVRALTTTPKLYWAQPGPTRALAQQVALAHVKGLKAAQWSLVDPESTRLYEVMAARFGTGKATNPNRSDGNDAASHARYNYAFGLLLQGRRAEAVKIARSVSGAAFYSGREGVEPVMDRLVGTHEFTAFLGQVVEGNPTSPFWDFYITAAARSRDSSAVIASLQRALAAPKLNRQGRTALVARLSTAQFAADRVDEGLATLKKAIAMSGGEESTTLAINYAKVGNLIGRPAVTEEGIAMAKSILNRSGNSQNGDYGYSFGRGGLADLLLDLGRPIEAEQIAIKAYVRTASMRDQVSYGGYPSPSLTTLAQLYYRLDRPADVRTLLDEAPDWGVRDALDLTKTSYGIENVPTGYVAAWALTKTGDKAGAEILLNRFLLKNGGFDPAYALLLELKGNDAIPRLEAIYSTDQFEERPLIWKAVALKKLGRLDEAETTVRQAIAVDPSDGETHGGHRLYAYTVLAEIQEAKGDAASARESRNAVEAIRMAEKADELAEVGLLTRAIAGYQASTRKFSDAYCIQSRLAVDLMEQGREKEAEEHYRRAYELMPNSFGRVETHCMGCEHVFEGATAQNIAERVFSALAKKTPEKPQVHYLLGYLRLEQGRTTEAMAEYRKAVALDPDYLNAWKQMASVALRVPTPPQQMRAISDAIARLDPLGKHGDGQVPTGDLKALWRRVESALSRLGTENATSAHPLVASAATLDRRTSGIPISMMQEEFETYGPIDYRTPGTALRRTVGMQILVQLLDVARTSGEMAGETVAETWKSIGVE